MNHVALSSPYCRAFKEESERGISVLGESDLMLMI